MSSTTPKESQGWTLQPGDGPGQVVLTGEIDFASTPAVRIRLLEALDTPAPEIVLHLAGLHYIDSSGLALFIEARKRLAESGRTIRIADISPQVGKIFNLTQLGELFGLPG
ncbi:STAS domain-containing protein [Solidesulfovibrio sp.]